MPKSYQDPLIAPRGSSAHDFSLKHSDWEAAAFDNAVHFAVIDYQRLPRGYTEFATFSDAAAFASDKPRVCVYAITGSGRNALLDRSKWAEWAEREKRAQSSV